LTISATVRLFYQAGNGVTVAFPFSRPFFANPDLKVYLVTAGVATLQTYATDYTIVGAGNPAGGTITFNTPPASGTTVVYYGDLDATQSLDLSNVTRFDTQAIEDAFDRVTILIQEIDDRLGRTAKLPLTSVGTYTLDLPTPSVGKSLVWNVVGGFSNSSFDIETVPQILTGLSTQIINGDAALFAQIAAAQFATGAVPNDSLPTLAALVLSTPNAAVQSIELRGFTIAGDCPAFTVTRSAVNPVRYMQRQAANGSYWYATHRRVNLLTWGGDPTGVSDTSAIINGILADLSLMGGGALVIPSGQFRLAFQIIMPSNTELVFEGGELVRDWQSTSGDKRTCATIRNTNAIIWGIGGYYIDPGPYVAGTRDTNIALRGKGAIRLSATLRAWVNAGGISPPGTNSASIAQLYFTACDYLTISDGLEVESGGRNWTISIDGDNALVTGISVTKGTNIYEDGVHVIGGKFGRIINNSIQSGDDAIAFGSNVNMPISDWVAGPNVVNAPNARAFAVFQKREGGTVAYAVSNSVIERISAIGITGLGGSVRNGPFLIRADTGTMGVIRDIKVDMNVRQGPIASHGLVNAQFITVENASDIEIRGRFRDAVRGGQIIGTSDNVYIAIDATDGFQQTGIAGLDHNATGRVVVSGKWAAGDRSIFTLSNATGVLDIVDLEASGIKTNFSLAELKSTGTLRVKRSRARKAAAQTNTRLISVTTAGGILEIEDNDAGDMTTGVDLGVGFSVVPSRFVSGTQGGAVRTTTTFSAAISSQGFSRLSVFCSGGTSANLSSITNGIEGQELEIISAEASPATVILTIVHGTGANNTDLTAFGAVNYALNSANKGVRFKFQGGRWMALTRW
jgi:hypothetical protein